MSKRRERRVTNIREVHHVEVTVQDWAGTFAVKAIGRSLDNHTQLDVNLTCSQALLPYLLEELRKVVRAQRRQLAEAEAAFSAAES